MIEVPGYCMSGRASSAFRDQCDQLNQALSHNDDIDWFSVVVPTTEAVARSAAEYLYGMAGNSVTLDKVETKFERVQAVVGKMMIIP